MTNKIRVAVIYGGQSGEHEISLISSASVIEKLNRNLFEVTPIAIDKQGKWFLNKLPEVYLSHQPLRLLGETAQALTPSELQRGFDVVFPVVHGTLCEDGTLQGLLELMNVPYVGAGVLASAMGMDKDITKRLAKMTGIDSPAYHVISKRHWQSTQLSELRYPLFVKPMHLGSSVGIHKVKTQAELIAACEDAFLYDEEVIVEEGLNARDVEIAVLEDMDGGEPRVRVVGEIIVRGQHEFYSYAAKYLDPEGAGLAIPADLPHSVVTDIQSAAKKIFTALKVEGMARIDFFVERQTNKIYLNEINTIPGFTQISMYPKLWQASGLAYADLLTYLVKLALARHERRLKIKRDWH